MSKKSKSYAAQLASTQEMLQALKKHLDTLKQRGMTQDFLNNLGASAANLVFKNSAQEEAKAALKLATVALDAEMAQASILMQEAVKVVKLAMPQPQWVEFGIKAKK